jgi:hypothetical protein
VTVAPEPADPATTSQATSGTTAVTGKTTVGGKRKHHKSALANSDSQTKASAQTSPVTTGVEPTCDADGDGVTDPGAPTSCSSGSSVSTGVEQGEAAPVPYAEPAPKKHKGLSKKKLRQRRAQAR